MVQQTEPIEHRGRTFVPVAFAERATQTHIELLVEATALNGIHLAPGERWLDGHQWSPIPTLVRYTGATPPYRQERPEIGVLVRGSLRWCGWADCPGLAAKVEIREHEWGYAHDLCLIVMNAALS